MLTTPVPLWRPRSPDDGLTEACPSEASHKAVSIDQDEHKHEQQRQSSAQKAASRSASSKQKR